MFFFPFFQVPEALLETPRVVVMGKKYYREHFTRKYIVCYFSCSNPFK